MKMKKYIILLLTMVLAVAVRGQNIVVVTDTAATDSVAALPWPENVQSRLDSLIGCSALLQRSQLGLMVYDLTADSVLYAHNERQTMRPASTMKLVTAIAALDRLGGNYRYETSLHYTGRLDSCTLQGDLYVVGGMDPCFDTADLNAFVAAVRQLGIDTIRGRIVADRSMKDADLLGQCWCWDDDNPVLSPLLIERKDVVPQRLMDALRRAGVVVQTMVTEGRLPGGACMVATRSHTMDQVLMKMMKDSDNLYAESMFYQLAAATGNRPATAKQARAAIRQLIARLGLQPECYKIADGSGLSLYNYLSPELEVRLLNYAYRNGIIRTHLYPALPIGGIDGTLKKRMQGTPAQGNVHAKTGTVTGVSALAGYLTSVNGHVITFSIMNQGVMTISQARAFQDFVCEILCGER